MRIALNARNALKRMHECKIDLALFNTATLSVLISKRNLVLMIKKSLKAILIKQFL